MLPDEASSANSLTTRGERAQKHNLICLLVIEHMWIEMRCCPLNRSRVEEVGCSKPLWP